MAITNGYATLDEVRRRIPHAEDDDNDDLESIIEGVSRFIDSDRGRRFYAASETRYYVPASNDLVVVDDLLSVTTLKTDEDGDGTFERTWTASDYLLAPYNANLDGMPYTSIERAFQGSFLFPLGSRRSRAGVRSQVGFRSVEILGSFGYTATTPKAIHEACVLLSMRLFERKEALFGRFVLANQVATVVPLVMDGELQAMLNTVKKRWTK
jgi:hypothetical protein